MFSLFRISEQELDRAIERVLTNARVEAFVERLIRKVLETALDQLTAGLRDQDREASTNGVSSQRPAGSARTK